MKQACCALAVTVLFAGSANARPVFRCQPLQPPPPAPPHFVLSLHQTGVTCKIARDVEVYSLHHETQHGTWKVDGHRWHGTIFSRANGHTYYRFATRGATVWETIRLPVS